MANTDWKVLLQTELDKSGLPSDIQTVQNILNRNTLKMMPQLDDSSVRNKIKEISSLLANDLNKTYNLNVNSKDVMSALKQVEKEFGITEKQAQQLKSSLNTGKADFLNKIDAYLRTNTALGKELKAEMLNIRAAADTVDDISGLKNLQKQFKSATLEAKALGQTGRDLFSQLGNDVKNFGSFLGVGTLTMTAINGIRSSIEELKNLDTILTEISKTSGKTREELQALGNSSFEQASKYGRTASDYLTSIMEMNRSGFYDSQGEEMAQLSLLAQSAGDMTQELADDYLLATNAAYGYNGSVKDLNAVLDGQDLITNRNSLSMTDMAEAMKVVGSQAANAGVQIDELSAVVAAGVAMTKKSGSEVGTALKSVFVNLQNITSSKVNSTLEAAGTSMTTLKDGIESLRSPMEILKDLAATYNSLEEGDPLKSQITTNIGGKYYSSILSSFLTNYDQYEKMLNDYAEADNTAMSEMTKSRDSWEGKLNALSNSWTSFVNTFTDAKSVKAGLDVLNGGVTILDKFTGSLGALGTIALGGGIVAFIKEFDTLKDAKSQLQNLTGIAEEINKIPVALNASDGMLSSDAVDAFAQSLQGLSEKQAGIVLSTTQLSDAQKMQAMAQAGIVASNEAISVSMAAETLAATGLDTATTKQVLTNAGLISSETGVAIAGATCTKAKLEEALATEGITGANAQAIVSQLGLTASNTATSVSFGVLTGAIWTNIKAMATWMATNPIGWIVGAGVALYGLVKAFDYVNGAIDRQKEKLADAKSEFSDATSDVDELNDSLEENRKAFDALASKSNLTYTEKGELEKLRQITVELERQADAAKKVQESKLDIFAEENSETFNQEFGDFSDSKNKAKDKVDQYSDLSYDFSDYKAKMATDIPELLAMQEKYNKALEDGDSDLATHIAKNMAGLRDAIINNGDSSEVLDELSNLKLNLLKVMDFRELTEGEQDTFNKISEWQKNIYSIIDPNSWNAMEFENILDTDSIERTKNELIELAKAGELTPEKVQGYENLNNAIQNSDMILDDSTTKTEAFIDEIVAYAQGASNSILKTAEDAATVDSYTLDEDSAKEVQNFEKSLTTVKQALEDINDLDSSDILDLMQELPTLDWDSYFDGTKDLQSILKDGLQGDLEDLSSRFPKYATVMGSLFDETFGNGVNKTEDLISALGNLSSAFDSLEDAYNETMEDGFENLSIDSIAKLQKQFGDEDGWDEFFRTITEGEPSVEQIRQGISDLCDEYVNTSGVLDGLNSKNADFITKQLEANGIVNASEVVQSKLAEVQSQAATAAQDLADSSLNASYSASALADMTGSELGALYEELSASGLTSQALYNLATAKGWVNSNVIYTDGDTANLDTATNAANTTNSAITNYGNAKIDSNGKTINTSGDQSNLGTLSGVADITQSSIVNYGNSKIDANNSTINTSGDIKNLSALSSAAVSTAANIANLNKVKAGAANAATLKNNYGDKSKFDKNAANPMQDFLTKTGNYSGGSTTSSSPVKKTVSYGGGNASNGSGGSKSTYKAPSSNSGGGGKSSSGNGGGSGSGKSGSGSSSGSSKETTTVIDWISTKLDKLEKKTKKITDSITDRISSSLKSKKLKSAISSVGDEIKENEKAYDKYMDKANKVGLSKKYRDMVKNGSLKIETIKGDKLKEQIEDYKKYYEAAQDCKESIEDLKQSQAELYEQWANIPTEKRDASLDKLTQKYDTLEAKASVASLGGTAIATLNDQAKQTKNSAKVAKDAAAKQKDEAKSNLNKAKKKINTKKLSKKQKEQYKKGQTISTKGLKGSTKKKVEAYNKSLKKYNTASSNYSSAKNNYSAESEYYNMVSTYGGKSYEVQNKLAQDELNNTKKQNSAYKKAYSETTKNLQNQKKLKDKADKTVKDYQKKLQNNKKLSKAQRNAVKAGKTMDLTGLSGNTLKNAKKYNESLKNRTTQTERYAIALEAQTNAAQEAAKSQAELAQKIVETAQAQNENIQNYYSTKGDYLASRTQYSDDVISLMEAKGETATRAQYTYAIKDRQNQIAMLKEERTLLEKNLSKFKANTEEWYQARSEIASITSEINGLDVEIEGLYDDLRDNVLYKTFSDALEKAEQLNKTLSSFGSLIDDDSLYNDDGTFTDFGLAKLFSNVTSYETTIDSIQTKLNEMDELTKDYKAGTSKLTKTEYDTKIKEAQTDLLSLLGDAKSTRDEIVKMMTNQAEEEVKAIQKVIDKKIELYKKEQEYYNYDKTLKNKDKEIQQIKAKIAALDGLADAESRAEKARLEAELQEKQDDLDDTVKEHVYDLKIEGLEDLKEVLSEDLDEHIKDLSKDIASVQEIIQNASDIVKDSSEEVSKAMDAILQQYGVSGSEVLGIEKPKGNTTTGSGQSNVSSNTTSSTTSSATSSNTSSTNSNAVLNSIANTLSDAKTNIGMPSESLKTIANTLSDVKTSLNLPSESLKTIVSTLGEVKATLSMPTSGLNLVASVLNNAKSSLKLPGFKDGGLVDQVRANGDDGLATLKKGEYVLDKSLTNLAVESLPKLNRIADKLAMMELDETDKMRCDIENTTNQEINITCPVTINGEANKSEIEATVRRAIDSTLPKIKKEFAKDLNKKGYKK